MDITEVRVKLLADPEDKLRGFCTITLFNQFVVRDVKIIEGPNGDLFLADSHRQANSIFLLRDANKDGKIDNATERFTFATGLNRPFGMAIQKVGAQTYFYVGNTDSSQPDHDLLRRSGYLAHQGTSARKIADCDARHAAFKNR